MPEHTTYERFAMSLDDPRYLDSAKRRAACERALLHFAESCSWDREAIIARCLAGPSGWLGREVFEASFDDGSMRYMAGWYDRWATERGHTLPDAS